MPSKIEKNKKKIIAGFIAAGILVAGAIMINQTDDPAPLTVQEGRM